MSPCCLAIQRLPRAMGHRVLLASPGHLRIGRPRPAPHSARPAAHTSGKEPPRLAGAELAVLACAVLSRPSPQARSHLTSCRCTSSASRAHAASGLCALVEVVPHGVLGSGTAGAVAAEPDASTAFVDPAGLYYIRNGPMGAGGAAGAIYKWLGIGSDPSFPDEVRAAITQPLRAKFHAYGKD